MYEAFIKALGKPIVTANEVAQNAFNLRDIHQVVGAKNVWEHCIHDIIKGVVSYEDFKSEYDAIEKVQAAQGGGSK